MSSSLGNACMPLDDIYCNHEDSQFLEVLSCLLPKLQCGTDCSDDPSRSRSKRRSIRKNNALKIRGVVSSAFKDTLQRSMLNVCTL